MKTFAVKSVCFLAGFVLLNLLFGYFLQLPKRELIKNDQFYPLLRWQEFYAQPEDSIDLLFLGSSHCYRAFDPSVFDAMLNVNSFNMGSGGQSPLTSYYVLREVLTTQSPKLVVFEAYWRTLELAQNFKNASYNLENMRPGPNRRAFYLHGHTLHDKFAYLLPAYRYRESFDDLVDLLLGKESGKNTFERYKGKGYVENTLVVSEKELTMRNEFAGYSFAPDQVIGKQVVYLRRLINLCRQERLSLVFVTTPLPVPSLEHVGNLEAAKATVQNICDQNHLDHIDYNHINAEQNIFDNGDFKDHDHLNNIGVAKLSRDLASRLRPYLGRVEDHE